MRISTNACLKFAVTELSTLIFSASSAFWAEVANTGRGVAEEGVTALADTGAGRGAGGRDGTTRPDRREAADIHAGRAFGRAATHEHVLDLGRVDLRALDGVLDRMAGHGGAVGVVEAAAAGLGKAGAGGRHDDCFSGHGRSPERVIWLSIAGFDAWPVRRLPPFSGWSGPG